MKQRLLGAVVLIALAIIFVPMILSSNGPNHESGTVDLEIPPAPNREFETRVLPVDPAAQTALPSPQTDVVKPEPVASVDTAAAPAAAPSPEAVQSAQPAAAKPAPPVAPSEPVAAKPEPKPETAATPAVAPGTAAEGRFLVHLGIYAESGNAADLVKKLNDRGFKAFSEATEFKGKAARQVRVGPFLDRAEAEAARIRIKQQFASVPGSVIALAGDLREDAPASASRVSQVSGWAVQLGAFSSIDEANKLQGRLQAAGFAGFVDKLSADGKVFWRVRAGPEVERANAEKLRDRIKDKLKLDGIVVNQT
ncbi:MAG: SPOR domain-containing protein [Dokdonella sp.]|uniref:SPOR domain-containing protein n=1 Tax=Dokdonella sp. TaxID=2291710 RepID=UPI0025BBA18B|nr:SPOR domain-containing protein [Dokdonella sp.]MBK8124824.1 SPOR domain-containing protein [Dokdonella sp.]HNV09560.1 SPOR domain-containing protein [Dokdonella sp.]HPW04852.1 SPOR domain-containing protein [Dokdonella sp.]